MHTRIRWLFTLLALTTVLGCGRGPSGKDRLEMNTVNALYQQAIATPDAATRKPLLEQILQRSEVLSKKYPGETQLWTARARAALELNRVTEGAESAQQLKTLGALDSHDPILTELMTELNIRGWLDAEKVAKARATAEMFSSMKGKTFKIPLRGSVELELVWVDADYWVGKYEVTQEEYEAVMGHNPAKYRGGRRPVELVSWNDAMEFCRKVTTKTQESGLLPKDYWAVTLPTEEQWEYFVADATLADAVHDQWIISPSKVQALGTKTVGSRGANRLGLFDVRGNVGEWCAGWFDRSHETRPVRGSDWSDREEWGGTGVSRRMHDKPNGRAETRGFRCVLVTYVQ